MEKLIYDSWILEAYFTENYYPKEIGHLIILLEINLHQVDINCSYSHCFFSHNNKIYFHTITEKANIEVAKSLLIYPENKYGDWYLNNNEWITNLEKINQNQIIVCVEDVKLYSIYENYKTLIKINSILDRNFTMLFAGGICFFKKNLDEVLKIFAVHNYTIILTKHKNNFLYPINIHFPTFHIHMEKILK